MRSRWCSFAPAPSCSSANRMPTGFARSSTRNKQHELEQPRRIFCDGRLRPVRVGLVRRDLADPRDGTLARRAPARACLARRAARDRHGHAVMTPRRKRLAIILGIVASVGVATALVLNAFQSNLVFFYSPSQVAAKEAPTGRTFRIGGLVQAGSVQRDGVQVRFQVTDTVKTIPVRYQGILPDLFKEGKGVVAQGSLGQTAISVPREGRPRTAIN